MTKTVRVNWDAVRAEMENIGVHPRNHIQFLSNLLGVHRTTVNRMRRGTVLPNVIHLSRVCELLNIGADRILTFKEVTVGAKEEQRKNSGQGSHR
jgi:DNA-binding XRE family transcriptional regulator